MVFGSIVQDIIIRVRADMKDFNTIAKTTKQYMDNTIGTMKNYTKASRFVTAENQKATKSYRAFRFELLSTMFFGQMLQRTMMGLLQPAFETAGIFDIISTILEVFFLPIALALLDPLLALMDWFLSMPESVQLVIGAIVLFLGILGGIIAMVSQVGLLLGSFGMTFTSLGGIIATAFGTIIGIIQTALAGIITAITSAGVGTLAIIAGIIIAIIAIIISFIFNVEGYFDAFATYIEGIMESVLMIFSGVFQIIEGIFTGDLQKILDGALSIFGGFFNLLYTMTVEAMVNFGTAFVDGISNAYQVLRGILKSWGPIGELILGGTDAVAGFISTLGRMISDGIQGAFSGIGNMVGGFMGAIGIPGFANGGIVTSPTLAMVGEAGPEAIIPLSGNNSGVGGVINYSPVYNFNNEINNSADVDYLISEIERKQGDDYERLRML